MSDIKNAMESTAHKVKNASSGPRIYECKPCKYVTYNKTLYNRHLNTEKHKNNIQNDSQPSQEDIQKIEEKRNTIINKDTKDCDKCFTSNVSPYHLSNGKFCANKIKFV